jgi:quercetin dioxygenase-like cupin family protein
MDEMKFVEFPTVLPPGPKVALVKGSFAEGQWMSVVKVPAGFVMPPHTHPDERTIIVVSGVLFQGEGEKIDEKVLRAFPPGSVIIDPPKEPHYHLYKEDTVFVEIGTSPTAVNYVNRSDAPVRK